MGPGAEATEGQGSYDAAGYPGSHGLTGSSHDLYTRHSAAADRVGSRGSVPGLRVQNYVHSINSRHSFQASTLGD